MNLLAQLRAGDLGAFRWTNDPAGWEPLPGGGLRIHAPARSDYFRDPAGAMPPTDSAPYLWLEATGDFVAQALVRPHFSATYDSGCLMMRHSAEHWAKLCFEQTDFGTRAAVSVVTRGTSDDANGVDLAVDAVWLQICRVGDVFGLHYSLDGRQWRMVRYAGLAVPATVRIGMVAQSPVGDGAAIDFAHFGLEARTVANLRQGV